MVLLLAQFAESAGNSEVFGFRPVEYTRLRCSVKKKNLQKEKR
jgi:hypothetical protein